MSEQRQRRGRFGNKYEADTGWMNQSQGYENDRTYPPTLQTRTDSGDAQTLGDMRNVDISDKDRRVIADRALKMIRRGLVPEYALCTRHRVICIKDPLGDFRDAGNVCHYNSPHPKWGTSDCFLVHVEPSVVYDNAAPLVPHLAEMITKMKQALDEAAKAKAKAQAHITEIREGTDILDSPDAPLNWQVAARKRRRELQHGPVTEGSRHYSFTD